MRTNPKYDSMYCRPQPQRTAPNIMNTASTTPTNILELESCLRAAKLRIDEGKTQLACECIDEARGWLREVAGPVTYETMEAQIEDFERRQAYSGRRPIVNTKCVNPNSTEPAAVFAAAGFNPPPPEEFRKADPRGGLEYGEFIGTMSTACYLVRHTKDGYEMHFASAQDFINWALCCT